MWLNQCDDSHSSHTTQLKYKNSKQLHNPSLSPSHSLSVRANRRWDARETVSCLGNDCNEFCQAFLGKLNWTKAAEDNVSHSLATWHNYQNWNLILRENIYQTKAFAICLREDVKQQAGAIRLNQSACKTSTRASFTIWMENRLKTLAVDWHDTAIGSQLFVNVFCRRRRWDEEKHKKIIHQLSPSFYWTHKAAHSSEQLHIIYSLLSHRNERNECSTGCRGLCDALSKSRPTMNELNEHKPAAKKKCEKHTNSMQSRIERKNLPAPWHLCSVLVDGDCCCCSNSTEWREKKRKQFIITDIYYCTHLRTLRSLAPFNSRE